MWRDLRLAARSLSRSVTFTLTATMALGLAIGANATIFALIDGLWFRPPAVADPDRLVRIFATSESTREGLWSWPEYADVRDRTGSASAVVAIGRRGATMAGAGDETELLLVNVVSPNFFDGLGIRPAHGRLPGQADDAATAEPVAVLGHAFWRRRFGADPSIVGKSINLGRNGDVRVTVAGILPAGFRELDAAADRDLWMPPLTWTALAGAGDLDARDNRWFDVVALRARGASVADVERDVSILTASFAQDYPAISASRGARVLSDRAYRLESGGGNAIVLIALVLLVVLITCVNVANLLLARGSSRAHELAVQVALGASRGRLLRQSLAESFILGFAGAVAGLVIALWLVRVLPAVILAPPGFRSFLVFAIDSRAALFTIGVASVTTLLFALGPSALVTRSNVGRLVGSGGRSTSLVRRGGLGARLVVTQVAVSLVLLSSAAVLARSFFETQRADLGFARKPLLTAWAPSGSIPRDAIRLAEERLATLPGVRRVGIAIRAPLSLSGGGLSQPVLVPAAGGSSADRLPDVRFGAIGPTYFTTLGTTLASGRAFEPADEGPGEPVAIVNQAFADRFFPDGPALGQIIQPGGRAMAPHRIVGVAPNVVVNRIGERAEPYFYLPYGRVSSGEVTFFIETAEGASVSAEAVRKTLRASDPRLEPRQLVAMSEYVRYSARTYQATAALAGALGLVGLALTALGLYGVMAHRTTRRTREFGIRVALGAARREVLRMVLHEGGRVAALGLAIGLPASLLATRLLRSMLFGVGPWDAVSIVSAAAVLAFTLTLAVLVPAWRATRVNPSTALRDS